MSKMFLPFLCKVCNPVAEIQLWLSALSQGAWWVRWAGFIYINQFAFRFRPCSTSMAWWFSTTISSASFQLTWSRRRWWRSISRSSVKIERYMSHFIFSHHVELYKDLDKWIEVRGEGISKGLVGIEADFCIDYSGADKGSLSIESRGPAKLDLCCAYSMCTIKLICTKLLRRRRWMQNWRDIHSYTTWALSGYYTLSRLFRMNF